MVIAAKVLFWASVALIAYRYLVFPALMWLIDRCSGPIGAEAVDFGMPPADDELPVVTVVVDPVGGERTLMEWLNAAVLQDYPSDRVEILVACPPTDDLTPDLVHTFYDPRVKVLRVPERGGRAAVVNESMARANGEVVVLAGAVAVFERDALRKLARHFRNPAVGAVGGVTSSGPDPTFDPNDALDDYEGRAGVARRVDASFAAVRRDAFDPLPANSRITGMMLAAGLQKRGLHVLIDDEARARRAAARIESSALRLHAQGETVTWKEIKRLTPLLINTWGRPVFVHLSHTLLDWASPGLLVAAALSNILLSSEPFYLGLLLVHEFVYLTAILGMWIANAQRESRWIWFPADVLSAIASDVRARLRLFSHGSAADGEIKPG